MGKADETIIRPYQSTSYHKASLNINKQGKQAVLWKQGQNLPGGVNKTKKENQYPS